MAAFDPSCSDAGSDTSVGYIGGSLVFRQEWLIQQAGSANLLNTSTGRVSFPLRNLCPSFFFFVAGCVRTGSRDQFSQFVFM
jgi:hypothetical protein